MNNKISFEALPQIVARLEEKLDALTETVIKLFQSITAPPPKNQEEMVAINEAANILHLSVSRVRALYRKGVFPVINRGETCFFSLQNFIVGCRTASIKDNHP